MRNHYQRGVTLVEFSIVIVAAMVLIGIALIGWARVERTNDSSALISTVSAIDQAIRTQYANEYSYAGLTVDTIAPHLPADYRPTASVIRSPFGGTITVVGRGIGGRQFGITISGNLPADACVDLVTRVGGQFWSVSRGAVTMKSASLAAIPVATAIAGCANEAVPLQLVGT